LDVELYDAIIRKPDDFKSRFTSPKVNT
jgi:hypothetical protein